MKVLLINNHHQNIGGSERYYFELAKLLKRKGHKVAFFSTFSPKNEPTKWQKYFVDKINFKKSGKIHYFKIITKVFYSFESRKKIKLLLNSFNPDIVHIQNIYYYISPSVLYEIRKRGIPIIQTIHDYQLISPSINFFHDGKICEITKPDKYYKALFHKCVKNSYIGSLIAVIASYSQHYFKFYERNVDYFITPSRFLKNKFAEYGFRKRNVIYLPNFLNSHNIQNKINSEEYVLYFGSLLEHKGVNIILDVARILPEIKFKIAGDGPERRNLISQLNKTNLDNVVFLGHLSVNKLQKVIRKSAFCIVPSLWYENMPYAVLESFALSKPVIASDIGGIPEMVNDHFNGLLFQPGNVKELEKKIRYLWYRKDVRRKLGQQAERTVWNRYAAKNHYTKLIKLYQKAVKQSRNVN